MASECIICGSEITQDSCSWCGFSQQPKAQLPGTLEYGTNVNGYVVGDVLDMDGESTSYLAYDTANQRKVILKEFLPVSMVGPRNGTQVVAQQGKEVLFKNLMMDFTDLYSSLVSIESKAIQTVYSLFSANGTVYAVMEHIKGDTLRQNLIKRGKTYTFKEARWLFQQLFALLDILEKNNIAHGGISDETVIVTDENNVVLTGFAIRDLRVKNEHIMYKLYDGFSAPEQYNLNRFSGFYTDIYSVAALFYHIVTGRIFTQGCLELKDLSRYMPKYAVQALKYATQPNPTDRLDNATDFVLMLDNKATLEKPAEKKKADSKSALTEEQMKKYLPAIIVVLIIILFFTAMMSINTGDSSSSLPTSSQSEEISQSTDIKLPDFTDKTYSQIMNDNRLISQFYFNISEEYSDLPKGQVIRQQPLPNSVVNEGTIIYLTISKGPEEVKVQIPTGLKGRPLAEVQGLLDSMGIRYVTKDVPQSRQYAYGTVTGTDIAEGVFINPKDTYVIIYVADNTPVATIPQE